MKIASIRILEMGGPLDRPGRSSVQTWQDRRGLLLCVEDGEGRVGQGEASPLPGYSPDTLEQVAQAFRERPLTSVQIDEQAPIAVQVTHACSLIGPGLPSAHFAFETALLDLLGQRLSRPLWTFLSSERPARRVPLSAWIDGEDEHRLLERAHEVHRLGIRTFKVKVGKPGAFEAELSALRALRAEFGEAVALRVDANGAFLPEEARDRIDALAEVAPELIEEPVPCEALPLMEGSPIPIALDESLQGREGCARLSALAMARICSAVVLKPTTLGGLLTCHEIARRARAGGAQAMVSHTLEGPVAMAAIAALAVTLPGPYKAAGLSPHPGLSAWPHVSLPMIRASEVVASEEPGLGIAQVDRSAGAVVSPVQGKRGWGDRSPELEDTMPLIPVGR